MTFGLVMKKPPEGGFLFSDSQKNTVETSKKIQIYLFICSENKKLFLFAIQNVTAEAEVFFILRITAFHY